MARTKTDPYSLRHLHQRAAHNADQAEFAAMLVGSTVVDVGIYDDRVAGAMDDFNPDDNTVQADWHRLDIEYDTAVGDIGQEIIRRASIMGDAYPFLLEGGGLDHQPSINRVYEFCLAICNAPNITSNPFTQLPRTFERLSAHIIQLYLGPHSESLHTGWPRDVAVGVKFKDAMLRLNKESGEWVWGPGPGLPSEPSGGDAGADFVAWKQALDGRTGQLFVLGQCACGDDWDTKFNDLTLESFSKWFHPAPLVRPVRAFVVPRHLVNGNLAEASRDAGIVFDRARLALIAGAGDNAEVIAAWKPKLDELINLVANPA